VCHPDRDRLAGQRDVEDQRVQLAARVRVASAFLDEDVTRGFPGGQVRGAVQSDAGAPFERAAGEVVTVLGPHDGRVRVEPGEDGVLDHRGIHSHRRTVNAFQSEPKRIDVRGRIGDVGDRDQMNGTAA
jgi:hypothetical protein